ncbi:hypothetical protein ABZX75_26800 [Streptomyces sp. NPDC003038]|uniref:hypothetical protein n=1 Tax=unclassified Streptomyces TaxID=2593676 RepID=UPI0033AD5535
MEWADARLGLPPPRVEFRGACLRPVKRAGFGAMVIDSTVSILAFFGRSGRYAEALSTVAPVGQLASRARRSAG